MPQPDGALLTRTKHKTQKPRAYGVVIYNDDYTPIDFVVPLLAKVFNLNAADAHRHTMEIHRQGRTLLGPYSCEVAETKATAVMDAATKAQHPLLAKFEPLP